jgi:hypothetical protein
MILLDRYGKNLQRCRVKERIFSAPKSIPTNGIAVQSESQDWKLTPLNWNVAFPRSPQHLSNQLRGKQTTDQSPQLDLFDTIRKDLSLDDQRELAESKVDVIGFNLTPPQQRAYEAALFLVNASGRHQRRIVITPEDWLRAYGLRAYGRERDGYTWSENASKDKNEAFAALLHLGMLPWFITYETVIDGEKRMVRRVAPLWSVAVPIGSSTNQPPLPGISPMTRESVRDHIHNMSETEKIAIEFDPIWIDQTDNNYFFKFPNLFERVSLAISRTPYRRQPKNVLVFLDWVFSKAGEIRRAESRRKETEGDAYVPRKEWVIRDDMTSIALQCRMIEAVKARQGKRIRESLEMSADIAIKAQIIKSYHWESSDFVVIVDDSISAKIDEHAAAAKSRAEAIEQQGQKRRGRKRLVRPLSEVAAESAREPLGNPFWKDPKTFSMAEIEKAIKEHQQALTGIHAKIGRRFSSELSRDVPAREPTHDEKEKLDYHDSAIRQFKDLKLGLHRPIK